MKKLALFAALMLALAGCNTIDGVGQDVSAGARAIDPAI
ncbi:MAG: entericidin EcnA/B family protein [Pseudomonadota bacterium]